MIEIKVGIERNSSPRELDRVGRGLIAFAQAMRDRAQPDPAPEPGVGVAPEPGLLAATSALAARDAEPETVPDAAPAPAPETSPEVAAPTGVELDSEGLPWDARIHSSSRQLLAKTQQWKRKRGVQPVLVTRVVEELRQALGVPAPAVEAAPAPAVEAAPAPAVETAPAPVEGAIQTLSELNTAVLAAGLDLAAVMPVVQEAGLASYALLGVRPDLIPAIARKLGLGG